MKIDDAGIVDTTGKTKPDWEPAFDKEFDREYLTSNYPELIQKEIKSFIHTVVEPMVRRDEREKMVKSVKFVPTARMYTGSYMEAYEDGYKMAVSQLSLTKGELLIRKGL